MSEGFFDDFLILFHLEFDILHMILYILPSPLWVVVTTYCPPELIRIGLTNY